MVPPNVASLGTNLLALPIASATTFDGAGETAVMKGMEGISQLEKEDQAAAMKQHVCPVSCSLQVKENEGLVEMHVNYAAC